MEFLFIDIFAYAVYLRTKERKPDSQQLTLIRPQTIVALARLGLQAWKRGQLPAIQLIQYTLGEKMHGALVVRHVSTNVPTYVWGRLRGPGTV